MGAARSHSGASLVRPSPLCHTHAMTCRSFLAALCLAAACVPVRATVVFAQDVRVSIDTTYYGVSGRTRRQWKESMYLAAAHVGLRPRVIASTRSRTRWTPGALNLTPSGCVAQSPMVDVAIRYTMPLLVPDSGASQEDLQVWRQYVTAVWRHEEEHGAHAYRAAVEMRDWLMGLRAPTCEELRTRLAQSVQATRHRYSLLDDEFDARERDTPQRVTLDP